MKKLGPKPLTISQQLAGLNALFPDGNCTARRNKLIWEGDITPTPLSRTYTIQLEYEFRGMPSLYVVDPALTLPKDREWPHLYKKDKLCLYYPGQWKSWMSLAKTIIPWASEWFAFYEIWLATGEWRGGGVHPCSKKKEE